ncbi:AAA domain-containing protein [Antrihabitans sp. NCIMB 15449]|uniref:AAA domain-containing protein n=1 Tax=Antrihabitans spumae TaxID=3373370 RepID=A0ABW7JXN2_9NOCA
MAAHLRAIDAANVSSAIMADLGVETAAAGSRSRRVNELHELRSAIRSVDQLVSRAAAVVGLLQSLNRSAPRIHSVAQADSLAAAAGTVAVAADAQQSIEWLNSVAVQVSKVCGPNAPQECADLELALQSANWDSIVSAFRAIEVAREQQKQEREFNALIGRLEQAAPELGSLIRQTPNDIRWPQWLRSFEDAWAWRCAHTWSQNQHDRGRDAKLERKLDDLDRDVAVLTSRVAAEMSWQACLSRVTATQVQALQSYRDHIASVGKGTGRHAERFRASAREAMLAAQGAVPAWVLPLQQVLASIPPEQNSFDVVIVDEASQADITSLFLLWLAPRVIVVGDDKQCAPSEVASGSFDGIFDKLDAYLPDMPGYLRNGFTPRSSMFSLLRSRFGNLVRLREHFRSMPEIIEWSSSQFYRDAPLVPLRQFGADRLPPLRTTFVEDGVESGKYASLSNRPEAMAIANEVERCLQNPAYDRMSFGVVVLQGQAQVELIQSELLSRISADDWDDRRLRVGTPPDFQGDERNVVFLSLVVGPDQQIRALTSNADQRRFNVGASRAQDQLWLFHSRPAESLRPSDLRHSLLTYMQITSPKSATAMPSDVSDIDRHPAFESIFEQRLYLEIAARGYQVNPQVEINRHRIDLVVTGAATRIAIECDGDTWQSGEERSDFEFDRELELKRCGWVFLRVRESQYYLDPFAVLRELWAQFDERGIQPIAVPVHHQRADRVDWQPARLPIDDQPASGLDDSLKTSTVEQPSADERYEEPAAQASTEPLLAAQQRDSTGAIDRVLGKAHHTPDDLRAAVLEEAKVGPVTTAGLAVAMGEDRGVLRKALRELVRTGELERQPGPKRGAQYVLSQVAVDEHSYGADEPDQAVESTTIPAWEVMASAAVLELPTRTGSRIYEIVRTSPSTELNLAVALGISRAHVVAAAGELVAQGRLVATDVDGGRGYSIPQARREPSASAPQQLHERTIVVQQLSDAAVEASAALLMSASEIAPLTLTRAARLTRANKSEVQRILSMLETAGRLEAIRVDSEVAWVRAEA